MLQSEQIEQYNGEEPFMVVLFSRQDEKLALPICRKMQQFGYRLRTVSDVSEQEEENAQPEYTGSENCRQALCFLSSAFYDSHKLRMQLNRAVLHGCKTAFILMEELQLLQAQKMQILSGTVLRYHLYNNEEIVFQEMREKMLLEECRRSDVTVYHPKDKTDCRYFLLRTSTGEQIEITHSGFSIGRKKELCDYAVENDTSMSKVHAVFDLDRGDCYVRDQHSLNKTYLNQEGIGIGVPHLLKENDSIEMGEETFIFHISSNGEPHGEAAG